MCILRDLGKKTESYGSLQISFLVKINLGKFVGLHKKGEEKLNYCKRYISARIYWKIFPHIQKSALNMDGLSQM